MLTELLEPREKEIFNAFVNLESEMYTYESIDRKIRSILMGDGQTVTEHEPLAIFTAKLLRKVDDIFDNERQSFLTSDDVINPEELKKKLMQLELEERGILFTFEEAWRVLETIITLHASGNPYAPTLGSLQSLEEIVTDAFTNGEASVGNLTMEDAFNMRSQAIFAVSYLIFDMAYGTLPFEVETYFESRDRYAHAMMAVQLFDDVYDVVEDLQLKIGNVFVATADEQGELSNVSTNIDQLMAASNSPSQLFVVINRLAPLSYREIYNQQQNLLQTAGNIIPSQLVLPRLNHTFQDTF